MRHTFFWTIVSVSNLDSASATVSFLMNFMFKASAFGFGFIQEAIAILAPTRFDFWQ
jgi:hypothetical protein